MSLDLSVFARSYAQARAQFLQAAAAAGLAVTSHLHPLRGREGEPLALDVALAGPARAAKLLIVSSAVHGVEGFCGSAVQVHALRQAQWLAGVGQDVAVLVLHAINPWGFSHLRRVTHENVDLNRNFQDFSLPLPSNPGYGAVHDMLLPPEWPPTPALQARLAEYIATHGLKALQAAVSSGQYEFADGLFFGGLAPTWSNQTLRQVLREHTAGAQHIAWVDLHTGLGPTGHGERIYAGDVNDAASLARAQAWWGGGGRTPITRSDDGSSASAELTGTLRSCADEELAHAQSTRVTLEFGTVAPMQVLQALRAEQWLQLHPGAPQAVATPIKQAMRDAFYVDEDEWKQQVLTQALEALAQGLAGLRSAPAMM